MAGVDSENAWFSFVKQNYRHLFPQLCSRSRFNRTRRALMQTTELLRQKMISVFPIPVSSYYIIDSFPLAVCKFGRARYCKAFRGHGADYGKCPSKKETYYGYKAVSYTHLFSFSPRPNIFRISELEIPSKLTYARHACI